jgi:enamine deaminase RidA (YjgF/YER057c/UK114 family)
MNIIRNIRTPIMHRAVEANGLVFVGGTIADDTSASMGEQTRNILGKIAGYLKEAGTNYAPLRFGLRLALRTHWPRRATTSRYKAA